MTAPRRQVLGAAWCQLAYGVASSAILRGIDATRRSPNCRSATGRWSEPRIIRLASSTSDSTSLSSNGPFRFMALFPGVIRSRPGRRKRFERAR